LSTFSKEWLDLFIWVALQPDWNCQTLPPSQDYYIALLSSLLYHDKYCHHPRAERKKEVKRSWKLPVFLAFRMFEFRHHAMMKCLQIDKSELHTPSTQNQRAFHLAPTTINSPAPTTPMAAVVTVCGDIAL
jgi:hypothetical protein